MKIYCNTDYDHPEIRSLVGSDVWFKVQNLAYSYPRFEYMRLLKLDPVGDYIWYCTVYPQDFTKDYMSLPDARAFFEHCISHCKVSPYNYLFNVEFSPVLPFQFLSTEDLLTDILDSKQGY